MKIIETKREHAQALERMDRPSNPRPAHTYRANKPAGGRVKFAPAGRRVHTYPRKMYKAVTNKTFTAAEFRFPAVTNLEREIINTMGPDHRNWTARFTTEHARRLLEATKPKRRSRAKPKAAAEG